MENHSVGSHPARRVRTYNSKNVHSALSEILDNVLPYDDVLALRDRMWELAPSLVRYDTLEHTSTDIALAGLKTLAAQTASAKVSGGLFHKPIANFYQTDPISRACVTLLPHTTSKANYIRDGTSQVGDNGAMYACVCQGRAIWVLRIGEVVSSCVRMTRRASYAGVAYRQFFDRWNLKCIKKLLFSFNASCG